MARCAPLKRLEVEVQAWRQGGRAAPHATGADRSHCGTGATTANTPTPLLWCAGTELAAQGSSDGFCHTGATDHRAGRVSHHWRGRATARARATQARTGALPGGSASVSSMVSDKALKLSAGVYVVQVGKRKFAKVTLI